MAPQKPGLSGGSALRELTRTIAYLRPDGARMIEVAPHVSIARRFVPLFFKLSAKPAGR